MVYNIGKYIEDKIVLCNSAIKLTNASFARRFAMYHLPILSFKEYLKLTLDTQMPSFTIEDILNNHTQISNEIIKSLGSEKILKHFQDYLKHGAYPFYFENQDS
ncbi:MAG: hypothetical protein U9R16_05290 [Campylobacterota bacterium]|nr:hypothetical protein [Campylobacterota bacterium]